MWLVQTYLAGPAEDFPVYAYFVVDAYHPWKSEVIKSIRDHLRILGRLTKSQIAILMPDEDIDRMAIDLELRQTLPGLLPAKIYPLPGGSPCGLLFSNKPLREMGKDGSASRWAFFLLNHFILNDDRLDAVNFEKLMRAIVECSKLTEGDPVSRLVYAFEGEKQRSIRKKLTDAVSFSVSTGGPGLSIKPGEFAWLFKNGIVTTNIYD
jgi:hypothetical protein